MKKISNLRLRNSICNDKNMSEKYNYLKKYSNKITKNGSKEEIRKRGQLICYKFFNS